MKRLVELCMGWNLERVTVRLAARLGFSKLQQTAVNASASDSLVARDQVGHQGCANIYGSLTISLFKGPVDLDEIVEGCGCR